MAAGRFSVFDPEEVEAIVAYLEYKARQDDFSRPSIDQALENYWRPRIRPAPGPRGNA